MKKITKIALFALVTFAGVCLIPNTTSYEKPSPEAELDEPDPIEVQVAPTVEAKEVARTVLYPALKRVCSCESTGKPDNEPSHFESDGVTVRKGKINPLDTGMCQINLKYHGDAAERKGLDLFDENDNITYANWLYDQEGLTPWNWSRSCWQ